jgi:hypothetical protein
MCDYSLQEVSSRPAKVGDRLISTRFKNTITRGFAAVDAPNIAVCLLPGTEIAFDREAERDTPWPFVPKRKCGGTVARFRQINEGSPHAHHDALEFPGGEIVLVTDLAQSQHATVLQLPAKVAEEMSQEPVEKTVRAVEPEALSAS